MPAGGMHEFNLVAKTSEMQVPNFKIVCLNYSFYRFHNSACDGPFFKPIIYQVRQLLTIHQIWSRYNRNQNPKDNFASPQREHIFPNRELMHELNISSCWLVSVGEITNEMISNERENRFFSCLSVYSFSLLLFLSRSNRRK